MILKLCNIMMLYYDAHTFLIRVLREIKKIQKIIEFLIFKLSFIRFVRKFMKKQNSKLRIQIVVFVAIQKISKTFVIEMMKFVTLITIHAKKITL